MRWERDGMRRVFFTGMYITYADVALLETAGMGAKVRKRKNAKREKREK
jgi:hypothetical protein